MTEISSSLSGKYISIFNKKIGYFEILKVNNSSFMDKSNLTYMLDEDNKSETLHFLS
jgi:hypothetical protein